MKLGIFMMPLHPHRPAYETFQEDLDKIIFADKLGYAEAWIGQHFTVSTEPIASPLMFMAAALPQTKNITFATGVINLPCHYPPVVASEVAQFDNMSRGRFIFGIGPGSLATDYELFGNPEIKDREAKTIESISMIRQIWSQDPPYDLKGKYWNVSVTKGIDPVLGTGYMLKPYQQPHPPIAISMMSPFSGTAKRAGLEGWLPISANFTPTYAVASHWTKYLEGSDAAGRKADPGTWRVARNMVVARTDEEAREMVFGEKSNLRYYYDYLWNAMRLGDYTIAMKADPKANDDDITIDMLLDDIVVYGSPKTITEKLVEFRKKVGPFGTLVLATSDWSKNRSGEEESMRLLASEVQPLLSKALGTAS